MASRPSLVRWRPVAVAASLSLLAVAVLLFVCAKAGRSTPASETAPVPEPFPVVEVTLPPSADGTVVEPSPILSALSPATGVVEPGSVKPAGHIPLTGVHPGSAAFAKASAEPVPFRFKRRDLLSAEELSKQLLAAPEIDLDAMPRASSQLLALAYSGRHPFDHAILDPLTRRSDLHGLPIQMGHDCQLGKECAQNLQALSRKLRTLFGQAAPRGGSDPRLDADRVRSLLARERDWRHEDALPTLVQLFQAEDRPLRLLLVELLAQIDGRASGAALVRRAVFDLAADVREAAVRALAPRPREEYRDLLLEGLRYPWAPAADHAAEAFVALDDQDAVPRLAALLNEPDPAAPARRDYKALSLAALPSPNKGERDPFDRARRFVVGLEENAGGLRRTSLIDAPDGRPGWSKPQPGQVYAVRELVRVNHLRNCLLCHAPAQNVTDPVRGLVPDPRQPLPPAFSTPYYEGTNGLFVRADVTYLRQDFSVPQPVAKSGVWPVHQRYDYVVRSRYPTLDEVTSAIHKDGTPYPQREAVRFALRELTGTEARP